MREKTGRQHIALLHALRPDPAAALLLCMWRQRRSQLQQHPAEQQHNDHKQCLLTVTSGLAPHDLRAGAGRGGRSVGRRVHPRCKRAGKIALRRSLKQQLSLELQTVVRPAVPLHSAAHLVSAQAVLVERVGHEHQPHRSDDGTRQLRGEVSLWAGFETLYSCCPLGPCSHWPCPHRPCPAAWMPSLLAHRVQQHSSRPTLDAKQALSEGSHAELAVPPLPVSPLSRPVPLSIDVEVIRISTLQQHNSGTARVIIAANIKLPGVPLSMEVEVIRMSTLQQLRKKKVKL